MPTYSFPLLCACRTYLGHLQKMRRLTDRAELEEAECVRGVLHQSVMLELRRCGIPFDTRDEAGDLACLIALS